MDRITASIATMPGREKALEEAVNSLLPQVDWLYVYLNGFVRIPSWLLTVRDKLTVASNIQGDLGDAGKIFGLDIAEPGYHFSCDDDLIYLPGYVQTMIEAIERYERQAVVTLHGKRITGPLTSYYRDRANQVRFHNQTAQATDEPVDVPGTGVMAWHTDTIRFTLDAFPQTHRNMADLHAGLKAAMDGVPVICIAHTGREVTLSPHIDHGRDTIFAHHRRDDRLQTEKANELYYTKQRGLNEEATIKTEIMGA